MSPNLAQCIRRIHHHMHSRRNHKRIPRASCTTKIQTSKRIGSGHIKTRRTKLRCCAAAAGSYVPDCSVYCSSGGGGGGPKGQKLLIGGFVVFHIFNFNLLDSETIAAENTTKKESCVELLLQRCSTEQATIPCHLP